MLQGPICDNTTLPARTRIMPINLRVCALYQITTEGAGFSWPSESFPWLLISTLSGVVRWSPRTAPRVTNNNGQQSCVRCCGSVKMYKNKALQHFCSICQSLGVTLRCFSFRFMCPTIIKTAPFSICEAAPTHPAAV